MSELWKSKALRSDSLEAMSAFAAPLQKEAKKVEIPQLPAGKAAAELGIGKAAAVSIGKAATTVGSAAGGPPTEGGSEVAVGLVAARLLGGDSNAKSAGQGRAASGAGAEAEGMGIIYKMLEELDDRVKELEGATYDALKMIATAPPAVKGLAQLKAFSALIAKGESGGVPPHVMLALGFGEGLEELEVTSLDKGLQARALAIQVVFMLVSLQTVSELAAWFKVLRLTTMTEGKGTQNEKVKATFSIKGEVRVPPVEEVTALIDEKKLALTKEEKEIWVGKFIDADYTVPLPAEITGGKKISIQMVFASLLCCIGVTRFQSSKAPKGATAYKLKKKRGPRQQAQ